MADRRRRAGWSTAAAVGAAIVAGIAVERAFVRRDRLRPDPYRDEPYGRVRGTQIGPVASFDGTLLSVEEAGSGPTVVLSHGFSLDSTLWHHQLLNLRDELRLVVFDHRGHGRSGRPPSDDWSLEALARDLWAVVQEAGGDGPVTLVGHSMGGMAVLKLCELFPEAIGERVGGISLVDTTAADVMGGMLPGVARRVEAALQGLQEALMRALAGRAETFDRIRANGSTIAYLGTRLMGFGPKPSPAQVAFVERLLAKTPSDVWLSLIPAIRGFDATNLLGGITVPALIVVGSHDRLTPPHAAERMASAIPRAELVVLEGAGHCSMLERHERFNAVLRRFVARVQDAAARR